MFRALCRVGCGGAARRASSSSSSSSSAAAAAGLLLPDAKATTTNPAVLNHSGVKGTTAATTSSTGLLPTCLHPGVKATLTSGTGLLIPSIKATTASRAGLLLPTAPRLVVPGVKTRSQLPAGLFVPGIGARFFASSPPDDPKGDEVNLLNLLAEFRVAVEIASMQHYKENLDLQKEVDSLNEALRDASFNCKKRLGFVALGVVLILGVFMSISLFMLYKIMELQAKAGQEQLPLPPHAGSKPKEAVDTSSKPKEAVDIGSKPKEAVDIGSKPKEVVDTGSDGAAKA